jgi:hypothetical protein
LELELEELGGGEKGKWYDIMRHCKLRVLFSPEVQLEPMSRPCRTVGPAGQGSNARKLLVTFAFFTSWHCLRLDSAVQKLEFRIYRVR